MTMPFDLAVRAALVLLVTLAGAGLLVRRSAALRHQVLAAGLAGSLAVAPVWWVTPTWGPVTPPSPPLVSAFTPIEVVEPAAPVDAGAGTNWPRLALLLWISGSAVRGLWLLGAVIRLRRTRRLEAPGGNWDRLLPDAAAALGVGREVELRESSTVPAPATWGWRRPVILVPEGASDWPEPRVQLVLLHELAHVRRRDWAIQLLAELVCAVYWFNPLTWIARDRLRRESDRACDDLVLGCGVSAARYGTELADIARLVHGSSPAGALLMARPSSLERRIVAMLDPALDRRPVSRRAALVSGVLFASFLLPAATLGVSARQAGSLTVQMFDPSGGVLPGATLELVDANKSARSTTTEGSGRAVFDDVSAGDYTISATLAGFKTLTTPITIGGDRDRLRSITLQVGELTETVTVRERRPPAGAAPPARGVVEPLRIGGNIKAPKKLRHVSPEYPAAMRDAGLEGTVPMEALIGRDGTVATVRVLSADVHPEFARAAEDAVRQWVFSATLLNGEAVDVRMAVQVRFSLQD